MNGISLRSKWDAATMILPRKKVTDLLTHLRLAQHLDAVLADELQQLTVGEAEELVLLGHLGVTAAENTGARLRPSVHEHSYTYQLK